MKRFVLTICALLLLVPAARAGEDSLRVMFWNLENFFDWIDEGRGESDSEFSSGGKRHWTRRRFETKCNAIAKTLMWEADRCGRMPDIVGFAEVENAGVLRMLLRTTALSKFGYAFVHYDSDDPRGIDVALLYRRSRLELLGSDTLKTASLLTRDILTCAFRTAEGNVLNVMVNHHPSKYGGRSSEVKRIRVMERMLHRADSLQKEAPLLVMGDFNDVPDGEAPEMAVKSLNNLALPLHDRGEGTIYYAGRWEMIDMFMLGGGLQSPGMEILYPPFLLTRDSAHSSLKPFRTWSGPRWTGGVSDHLPIAVTVNIK